MIKFYNFDNEENIITYKDKLVFSKETGLSKTTSVLKNEYEIIKLNTHDRIDCVKDTDIENIDSFDIIKKFDIKGKIILIENDYNNPNKKSLVDQCFQQDDIILTDTAGLKFIIEIKNIDTKTDAQALSGAIYKKIGQHNNTIQNTIKDDDIFKQFKDKEYNDTFLDRYYNKYLNYTNKSSEKYAVFKSYKYSNGNIILNIIHSIGPHFRDSDICKNSIKEINNLQDINKTTNIYKLFYAVYRSIYLVFYEKYIKNNNLKLYMVPYSIGVFAGIPAKNKPIILYTIFKVLVDLYDEEFHDKGFIPYLFIEPEYKKLIHKIIINPKIEE
jgi:hypothetical protein